MCNDPWRSGSFVRSLGLHQGCCVAFASVGSWILAWAFPQAMGAFCVNESRHVCSATWHCASPHVGAWVSHQAPNLSMIILGASRQAQRIVGWTWRCSRLRVFRLSAPASAWRRLQYRRGLCSRCSEAPLSILHGLIHVRTRGFGSSCVCVSYFVCSRPLARNLPGGAQPCRRARFWLRSVAAQQAVMVGAPMEGHERALCWSVGECATLRMGARAMHVVSVRVFFRGCN